ncbi:hypothetical protein [Parasitella parasitica]|uniref:Uncharacterized protein n=1 Tax=Parasitella parasitica TaxID=35722 RepID=A0A0B7NE11_9FUNG|nr:hypothetical protein [Parasitella parasitica]
MYYLQENDFSEAKGCVKEALKSYLEIENTTLKSKTRAEALLKRLNRDSASLKNFYEQQQKAEPSSAAEISQTNKIAKVKGNLNISHNESYQNITQASSSALSKNSAQYNDINTVSGNVNISNATMKRESVEDSNEPIVKKQRIITKDDDSSNEEIREEFFDPPNNREQNEVDFDNLPIAVDPPLNQDVLASLEEINEYIVDGVEYHKLFADFKTKAFRDLQSLDLIYLEPNFYKLIALQHILFLKPGSFSADMIVTFGERNLSKLYNHLHKKYFDHDTSKYNDILTKISNIFNEFPLDYQQVEDRLEDLYHVEKDVLSRRTLRCLLELVTSLPPYKEYGVVNELDLKMRFINPIFKPFLNDIDNKFRLHWPESNPIERKVHSKATQRPDALISNIEQSTFQENIGFMEVKSSLFNNRNRALILDMYRLVYFSRATIDVDRINSPIIIQVVGAKVNVYMHVLMGKKFYVTFFLFNLNIPFCIDDIQNFVPGIKKLISLHHALACCSKRDCLIDEDLISESQTTPLFEKRVECKVYQGDMERVQLC